MAKMHRRLTKLLTRNPGAGWDWSPAAEVEPAGDGRRPVVRSTLCLRHRRGARSFIPFPRSHYEEGQP